MNVFEVCFNRGWGKEKAEIPRRDMYDDSLRVAAVDAEEAIKKVKAMTIGEEVNDWDDNGDEIADKYIKCNSVRIGSVTHVTNLDG